MPFGFGKQTCLGCGYEYGKREKYCPACLTPAGERAPKAVRAGGPATHVRTYAGQTGLIRAKGFARDAARIARVGWKPTSQSEGGLILTVVYIRNGDDEVAARAEAAGTSGGA